MLHARIPSTTVNALNKRTNPLEPLAKYMCYSILGEKIRISMTNVGRIINTYRRQSAYTPMFYYFLWGLGGPPLPRRNPFGFQTARPSPIY